MYITAGTFNIILRQVSLLEMDEAEVFSALGIDSSLFEKATNKIDSSIVGQSLEYMASQRPNIRIGLKMGFNFPVSVMGVILNLYQNCRTLKDVFQKSPLYAPAVNTRCLFSNHSDEQYFYHSMQVYESQYGIILQLIYALTGKHITPVSVHSPYKQETTPDLLETLMQCPVRFDKPFMMIFDKEILETHITNANPEMLFIAEQLISGLLEKEQQQSVSSVVRRYILQTVPGINLSLKSTARDLNMSDRTLQRKLLSENTSYQTILDDVRKELATKYLKENISLVEISFLLGFETQSAFNKFFKKHFEKQPSVFRKNN